MSLASKLMAYWPLDEASGSRADAHSGGHTLTDNNTVGSATGLVYSLAANFASGSSEYLSHANHADLRIGNNDRTIAAWLYHDDNAASNGLVSKGVASGWEWYLEYNWGNNVFAFRAATGDAYAGDATVYDNLSGGNPPVLTTAYLVIAWHNAGANQIGIASSLNSFTVYTEAFGSAGIFESSGDFEIGRANPTFPNYTEGRIGPVVLFNALLTGGEMTELYNAGAGLTYAAITGGASAVPVFMHHYRRRRM